MPPAILRRLICRWDLSDQDRAAYRKTASAALTQQFSKERPGVPLLRPILPEDLGLKGWEFKTIDRVLPEYSDMLLTSVALLGPDIQDSIVDTMLNIDIGFKRYYSFSLAPLAMPFLLAGKLPRTWKGKAMESLLPEGWLSYPVVISGGHLFHIEASLPVRLHFDGLIAEPAGVKLASWG